MKALVIGGTGPEEANLKTQLAGIEAEQARLDGLRNSEQFEAYNGGVAGYKIEPIWLDTAYDSAKVVTIMNRFMDEGALLWGTASSKEATAAMEIANRAGFPGMASFTAPSLYRPPKHVFGQMPDYGDDWSAFANYYLKNIWKK